MKNTILIKKKRVSQSELTKKTIETAAEKLLKFAEIDSDWLVTRVPFQTLRNGSRDKRYGK